MQDIPMLLKRRFAFGDKNVSYAPPKNLRQRMLFCFVGKITQVG